MSGRWVDSFAGGGGASLGIHRALGRPVDVAINHCDTAIRLHSLNHPQTEHYPESVWDVDPASLSDGQTIEGWWASPDCRHFSRAGSRRPKHPKVRALAWSVVRAARRGRPNLIFVENVPEFEGWCRLQDDGRPDWRYKGEYFRRWVGQLRKLGYAVEWRVLRACDYGVPTLRERLFIVARRDGLAIRWPEPTHGPGRPRGFVSALDVLDLNEAAPSVLDPSRPLVAATLKRIFRGVERFVLNDAQPVRTPVGFGFVVKHFGGMTGARLDQPFPTLTTRGTQNQIITVSAQRIGKTDAVSPGEQRVADALACWTGCDQGARLEIAGDTYALTDVGMRLPTISEAALIQGFDTEYIISPDDPRSGITKTEARAKIGNSVCPGLAQALVAANVGAVEGAHALAA